MQRSWLARLGLVSLVAATGLTALGAGVVGAQTDDAPRPAHAGPRGPHGLEAAAEVLGLEVEDLRERLRGGDATLAEVAADENVDVDDLVAAMVAEATERIDQKVADGDLDADRAAEIKADLEDRITTLVNEGPQQMGGLRRGGRCPGGDDSESERPESGSSESGGSESGDSESESQDASV